MMLLRIARSSKHILAMTVSLSTYVDFRSPSVARSIPYIYFPWHRLIPTQSGLDRSIGVPSSNFARIYVRLQSSFPDPVHHQQQRIGGLHSDTGGQE